MNITRIAATFQIAKRIANQVLIEYNEQEQVVEMPKVKDITTDDLEYFIEQKLLEILGDPDSSFELKQEFKKQLQKRLGYISDTISHEEVLKEFG